MPSRLEKKIEEKYEIYCCIGKMNKEGQEKFDGKYALEIWYNDMFCWASSDVMEFIPRDSSSTTKVYDKFVEWMDKEGKALHDKFDKVKYPIYGEKTYEKDLDNYFKKNWKIGKKIAKSIDKFCGKKINEE